MKVEFQLSEDEYIEFNLFLTWKPNQVKGARSISFFITLPFAILVAVLLKPYMVEGWQIEKLVGLAILLLGTVSLANIYKKMFIRSARAAYATNKEIQGNVIYDFRADNFYSETIYCYTVRKWESFQKIEESDGLLLVFINDRTAYIIPKRVFKNSSDIDAFTKEVSKYFTTPMATGADTNIDEHLIAQ